MYSFWFNLKEILEIVEIINLPYNETITFCFNVIEEKNQGEWSPPLITLRFWSVPMGYF